MARSRHQGCVDMCILLMLPWLWEPKQQGGVFSNVPPPPGAIRTEGTTQQTVPTTKKLQRCTSKEPNRPREPTAFDEGATSRSSGARTPSGRFRLGCVFRFGMPPSGKEYGEELQRYEQATDM
mmetsp:Transcript_17478/g.40627  ORF Transcript_17478/g.40627 Transcript_17478/m.40627 type:complete len:123 (+) Transcript_17478:610-978(+)